MTSITIITRNGEKKEVKVSDGENLMDVAKGATEDIEAMCGGCLSCATCHVYVDPVFVDCIPPPTTAENELLDALDHRKSNSRLACQVYITSALAGLSIAVAPEG